MFARLWVAKMARALMCCLGALCVAHLACAGGDGLVFGVCPGYTNLDPACEHKVTLSFRQSLPNATARKLTFFHSASVDVRAATRYQELRVDVLGQALLFPPSDYATSTVTVTRDTLQMTHVGDEAYLIPNISTNNTDPLDNVHVYGHYVTLNFVLLEQQTAYESAWHKVAWWDFHNTSTFQSPRGDSKAIRISTHDATNGTTFAGRTGLHPQWLMSGDKHVLRTNLYDGEGGYYAERLGRQEFDEEVRTCRLYTQTFRETEISFGCLPGYGRASEGGQCSKCPHGEFADQDTKSKCVPCEPYLGTETEGSKKCVSCPVGKFLDMSQSGKCVECRAGTYRNETMRAEDKAKEGMVAVYEEACVNCPTGTYGLHVGSVSRENCTRCDAGKYSSATGNATKATCRACAKGEYALEGSSVCVQCPENRTTESEQTSEQSCVCERGFFEVGDHTCSACAPGKFNDEYNQTECQNCSAGQFQGGTNATACHACGGREYAAPGSESCSLCPDNASTQNDMQELKIHCLCDPGYNGRNGSECEACEAGTYTRSYGNANCTKCSAGKFQNQTAKSACVNCASGKFSESGKTVCQDCPEYSGLDPDGYPQGNIGDCQCMPGYFNNQTLEATSHPNEDCTACSAGQYKEHYGNQSCTLCKVGTFQNRTAQSNQTACRDCQPTQYSEAGAETCHQCPNHTTARWKRPDMTDCQCNQGYTGPDGGVCDACEAGTYKDELGAVACSKCKGGTASSATAAISDSTCEACTFVQYAPAGSPVCQSCPSDAQSVEPRNVRTTCKCNAGSTGLDGVACSACDPGTYKPLEGSQPCTQCASGKYSAMSKQVAEDTCIECKAHEYAPAGSQTCSACPNNTETWSPRATKADCKCRRGYNGTRDGAACDPCRPGTFKHLVGAGGCVTCPPGTFSEASNASWAGSCQPCNPGTYSGAGSTDCEACGANAMSDKASGDKASCECEPGFTLDDQDSACKPCGPNQVKALRGNGECHTIPAHSQKVAGKQTWQCNAGYTLHIPEACKACPRGEYKVTLGNHACKACDTPKTTAAAASTSASECVDTVAVDRDGDGVLNPSELKELESRTHLHLAGLEGTTNVTTGMVAQLADDVALELAGNFSKGEVFYQYQSAGGEDSTFAVDVDLVMDAMSAKGVDVNMEVFDENDDDLTDSGEWASIKRALQDVSVLVRQGEADGGEVPPAVASEGSGVSGSLVVIFAVVFVVLVAIALLRRSLSGGRRRR